jgi:hypothetical protein
MTESSLQLRPIRGRELASGNGTGNSRPPLPTTGTERGFSSLPRRITPNYGELRLITPILTRGAFDPSRACRALAQRRPPACRAVVAPGRTWSHLFCAPNVPGQQNPKYFKPGPLPEAVRTPLIGYGNRTVGPGGSWKVLVACGR